MSTSSFDPTGVSTQIKCQSVSGRGQACSKFQHDAGLPNLLYLLDISESTVTSLSDPKGVIMLSRARYAVGRAREIQLPGYV